MSFGLGSGCLKVLIHFPPGWCLYGVAWLALHPLFIYIIMADARAPFLDAFDYVILWHGICGHFFFLSCFSIFIFWLLVFWSFLSCMGGLNGLSYIPLFYLKPHTLYLILYHCHITNICHISHLPGRSLFGLVGRRFMVRVELHCFCLFDSLDQSRWIDDF